VVGWILAIAVAVLVFYTADTVVYIATWLVSYLNAAFSALGIRIAAFDYLDILYPYFRSAVQVIAIGTILAAALHIAMSIREQT
jgi:hypothetical protein